MRATTGLLAAVIAAGGVALATDAWADRGRGGGHGARGHGGHFHGGRHWGGHRHRGGHRHWHGGWGLWLGAPIVIGSAAWGWPYAYGYPRETIIYREREVFPEGVIEPMPTPDVPTTQVPEGDKADGAPSRGPLYMNYCESARAYFPKVTRCPEGWKLATPTS